MSAGADVPDRLVAGCHLCSWRTFGHNDELGPREVLSAMRRHLEASHPGSILSNEVFRHRNVARRPLARALDGAR